jgi:hypothetical protein
VTFWQDDTTQGSEGLKEDELLEEELMVLSSANPRLVSDLQAVSGEMNHLHWKYNCRMNSNNIRRLSPSLKASSTKFTSELKFP